MEKICIVGAGQMGLGIAQVCAAAGFKVILRDVSDEILQCSMMRLDAALTKLVDRNKITEQKKASIITGIVPSTELADVSECDIVIEAVIENAVIKKAIFKELDEICKSETIFASNTSSITITDLASSTKRPCKFIGMHFFNPVAIMKLVELIKGLHTSQETFDKVHKLAVALDKEPVTAQDSPGFIVNKILIPMINEAICVLEEGVASIDDIDKAMKLGANHPLGPLSLSDLIGNDTVLHIMDTLYKETGEPKYRASRLLRQMVRGGRLGRKSGRGFYDYTARD